MFCGLLADLITWHFTNYCISFNFYKLLYQLQFLQITVLVSVLHLLY